VAVADGLRLLLKVAFKCTRSSLHGLSTNQEQVLPTWYEVDTDGDLLQIISTSDALGSVVFDPTYTAVSCAGYFSTGDAYFYLNMDAADPAWCPVRGMFTAAQDSGYFPVWGDQPTVNDQYGKVLVKENGGCSYIPDALIGTYDFTVPCGAHDYCYDLRKAAFSGTVTDLQCDQARLALTWSDCEDRIAGPFQQACYGWASVVYNAVTAPLIVTNQNPGIVEIRNQATGQCADVEGPSTADNIPIQQWSCVGVSNQRFKIWEAPGAPGYFQIQAMHSAKCGRALSNPVQFTCQNVDSMRFRIQGALNQNLYSVRSKFTLNECWKVPNSYSYGLNLVDPVCNDSDAWFIWRIVDV
jgi:hypothetical protein